MTVNTGKVESRRTVRYESLDDLLADVRALTRGEHQTVGNWTLGQILEHLAVAINGSIDGLELHVPWTIKIVAPLLKRRFLEKPLPAGFQIKAQDRALLEPPDSTTSEQAARALEAAIARLQSESQRARHPILGSLTREQWNRFHLRHAELHMSFVKPA